MAETEAVGPSSITVRIVKSFEYKNFRTLVFHHVDLYHTTLSQLRDMVWERIRSTPNLKQYEKCSFDTMKMYYQAHGAKTNNPMINIGGDDVLVLHGDDKCLAELGFRHETEVSYFNKDDYERYKLDPTLKW